MAEEKKPAEQKSLFPEDVSIPDVDFRHPDESVELYRNLIRVKHLLYLSIIPDCIKVMGALHKTQLLAIRESHRQKEYIPKTDYNIVKSLFDKYHTAILTHHGPLAKKNMKSLNVLAVLKKAPEETKGIDDRIEKVLKEQAKLSSGNFTLLVRPEDSGKKS